MVVNAIIYFFLCWDKSWKQQPDPGGIFGPYLSKGMPVERRTVYFLRHGESLWNQTFNKGSHRSWRDFAIAFVPGLIKAIIYEIYLLISGKLDRYDYEGCHAASVLREACRLVDVFGD